MSQLNKPNIDSDEETSYRLSKHPKVSFAPSLLAPRCERGSLFAGHLDAVADIPELDNPALQRGPSSFLAKLHKDDDSSAALSSRQDDISCTDGTAEDKSVRKALLMEEKASFMLIKEGHIESKLCKDTTSFIITSPNNSAPFAIGFSVGFLKIFLYILAFVNWRRKPNTVTIDWEVAVTQFLAVFLASFTNTDIANAVKFIYEGYDSYQGHFDGNVTYGKWVLAVCMALAQGGAGLTTMFDLILTSRDVLTVFLNFAAVYSVMHLDRAFFVLASSAGILGKCAKWETERISTTTYRVGHNRPFGGCKKVLLLSLTTSIFVIMLILWLTAIILGQKGYKAPNWVVVQFEDSVYPALGTHSGIYELHTTGRYLSTDPFHWKETSSQEGTGVFGFCKDRWTFFLEGGNPCGKNNVMESVVTSEKFDFLKAANLRWFIQGGTGANFLVSRLVSSDGFSIAPICQRGGFMSCGKQGECIVTGGDSGKCRCNAKQSYGVRCQFSLSWLCLQIKMDARYGYGPLQAGRILSNGFDILLTRDALERGVTNLTSRDDVVMLYHRPVYTGKSIGQEGFDVLFYTGLRWAITGTLDGFNDFPQNATKSELADFLGDDHFHANFTVKKVDVLSEQVIFESNIDHGTPVGLSWVKLVEAASLAEVEISNEKMNATASLRCNP